MRANEPDETSTCPFCDPSLLDLGDLLPTPA